MKLTRNEESLVWELHSKFVEKYGMEDAVFYITAELLFLCKHLEELEAENKKLSEHRHFAFFRETKE